MSIAREHADWLSLLDVSGPFLSLPVLLRAFPQGIEPTSSELRSNLRQAYLHWQDERDSDPTIHYRWIRWLLTGALEFDEEFLADGPRIPASLERPVAEHHEILRPDLALLSSEGKPLLLVHIHPVEQDLTKPLRGAPWKASPDTRMAELLRGTGCGLGIVTNGERWMLVHAPAKETAGYASWYADIWVQEPLTFRAFTSLLRLGRFVGVAENETLPALLRDSAQDQADVTDQLGAQVRAAVQVLVQAFDKLDAESGRTLLAGVNERALYEAALTVMMRLVFLLSAEERKLLLRGDPLYDQHYAVGTILDSLQEKADRHGEEILERACDAWSRLLAVFRAVHGGVQHERLRLPAYGGTLFDPDRFAFLEGRAAETKWKASVAQPLKVNNRVVLHLLRALQFIETKLPGGGDLAARRLSFRGLDIEQIGHVYEGLLDHTARRATQLMLGLGASKGRIAAISLENLEALATQSQKKLIEFLAEETERSESTIRNALGGSGDKPRRGRKAAAQELDLIKTTEATVEYHTVPHSILAACDHDAALAARVVPFAALLRNDTFAHPLVILPDSLYVTSGSDRRSTGTHYTPRSLTEPIVEHTLEPLVYAGPAEGLPREQWRLKNPRKLLALKICDLAMGSGAFLVATCRYLSARLVEAWAEVERAHPDAFITSPEGDLSIGDPSDALIARLPDDDRFHLASRAVADRCLYGVDVNPMAVEMAKLSLWLITVDRERPFNFLDHALKCGDSLLGISTVEQLNRFSVRDGHSIQMFPDTINLFRHVEEATKLRVRLEETPSHTAAQLADKARLNSEAENLLTKLRSAADFLIAAELDCPGDRGWENRREVAASHMQAAWKKGLAEFQRLAHEELGGRRPFHWPLEFPEVFGTKESSVPAGFDAFVGNPPYMGGTRVSSTYGQDYLYHLVGRLPGSSGNSDFAAFFVGRTGDLLGPAGAFGLVTTSAILAGDSFRAGPRRLMEKGFVAMRELVREQWPGQSANVAYVALLMRRTEQRSSTVSRPQILNANDGLCNRGSDVFGEGFIVPREQLVAWERNGSASLEVVMPYLGGAEFNNDPRVVPSRYIINFGEMSEDEARSFSDAYERVSSLVKPARRHVQQRDRRELWWLFATRAPSVSKYLNTHSRCLAIAQLSKHIAFAFVSQGTVFANTLLLILLDSDSAFALLQSSFHAEWVFKWGGAMRTDTRYTSTECFETFPFPADLSGLESIGECYHEHRRQLMQARGEGLTKIYNRFHDSGETAADVAELRTLHRQLDLAVAAAYGWADLAANDGNTLGHDFHETKQGLRYTLAPAARREVLDRLLALNHQRYAEEVAVGLHEKKSKKKNAKRGKQLASSAPRQAELIPPAQGDLFDIPTPETQSKKLSPQEERILDAAFARELIINLLSAAPNLRMSELRRAFDLIVNPDAMIALASTTSRGAVQRWADSWHSPAARAWFIPTMEALAGGTLIAGGNDDDPPMVLKVSSAKPESPQLREGISLALQILRAAPTLTTGERDALIREVRPYFTAV
jgi:hypothetical protein